ncbi:MAG: cation transporter [Caulobacterales bacterium]|nr:cation transporter [Caulobacterales bacterium]
MTHDQADHDHSHGPRGHDHGHAHGPGGHHHHAAPEDWRYGVGLIVNLIFVFIEFGYGIASSSTALIADAGHNLSDVLGLGLAGGAAWLARRAATNRRTYGYRKATVLAALGNAIILVFACGAIAIEAVRRAFYPLEVASTTVMVVAGIGFIINLGTALLFLTSRKHDLNARGAWLHMIADAAVSIGVVIAGALILFTGWSWIDPLVGLLIVVVILWGTWGLLTESLDMALDSAPAGLDVEEIRTTLAGLPGVIEAHHLHVWSLSTTERALTAHLVRAEPATAEFYEQAQTLLKARFGVGHATLQVETTGAGGCAEC